jgi:hypothetical protein
MCKQTFVKVCKSQIRIFFMINLQISNRYISPNSAQLCLKTVLKVVFKMIFEFVQIY